MSPLPTGPLSPKEEADWRDIARDPASMTARFFATLDAARYETKVALARLSRLEDELRKASPYIAPEHK